MSDTEVDLLLDFGLSSVLLFHLLALRTCVFVPWVLRRPWVFPLFSFFFQHRPHVRSRLVVPTCTRSLVK